MLYPNHGANPSGFYKALNIEMRNNFIDFSVNTNPLGPPKELSEVWAELYSQLLYYPEPKGESLRQAVAIKEGLPEEMILIGNGGAELIYLVSSLFQTKQVLILEPTFSEYAKGCQAYGGEIKTYQLREEDGWQWDDLEIQEALWDCQGIFLAHPNNPTGAVYDPKKILSLIEYAEKAGIYVIVDEAFYDFSCVETTLLPYLKEFKHLIILRSFTKMYQIPGIRLGLLFAQEKVIEMLTPLQPEWSVNRIAIELGKLCLQTDHHVMRTKTYVAVERNRVVGRLKKLGFVVADSYVNYYLMRLKEKQDLAPLIRFLAEQGIVVRHTYNFKGLDGNYLRIAVRQRDENDYLLSVLERWQRLCSSL